jgi:hypothetical protein
MLLYISCLSENAARVLQEEINVNYFHIIIITIYETCKTSRAEEW